MAAAGGLSIAAQGPALAFTPVTFSYPGADQTYTVPAGVTEVRIVATGAGGSAAYNDVLGDPGSVLGSVP
ncbi:MAG: hypothetical protein WCP28_18845 [Actinomycetes bacterium]